MRIIYPVVLLAVLAPIFWLFREAGTAFCLGVIFGVLLVELCHRIDRGFWFSG